jgi:hypothetical protein
MKGLVLPALIGAMIAATSLALAGCEPRKPGEPKTPTPKVDFTHERSNA